MQTFIFGASGFAKEVEWLISDINHLVSEKFIVEAFVISDSDFTPGLCINTIPIISETTYLDNYNKIQKHNCILALGNPLIRTKVYNKIKNHLTLFPSLIHPSTIFDRRPNLVKFEMGCIVCAGCILTTVIKVGMFVHINLDSTVGHDSIIGDFVTISPSVNISGKVKIGKQVFIGTGVTINEELEICDAVVIGSGASVIKTIVEVGTYVGVPVKKIK